MFFNKGRCDLLRSLSDLIPCAWQIATRYRFSNCFWSHFKSGNKTNPVTGSGSSNTTRSASAFFSRMLYTHCKKKKQKRLRKKQLILRIKDTQPIDCQQSLIFLSSQSRLRAQQQQQHLSYKHDNFTAYLMWSWII